MKTENKNSYLESINKAIAYIESNSTTDIQLKDISIQANLSQYHFHRVFKSITGNTIKDFLTRIRLEKSALKLKHSQNDIGQIAFECGYQNHETFTRAFKDYFGLTPIEYRNSIAELTTNKQNEYGEAKIDLNALNVQRPIIKTIPDQYLAYIRHTGSYDKVGSSFQRLMFWAATHLVLKLKPATIGIVHDNPDLTAEQNIRFDACILLSKEIKPSGEIGYKKLKAESLRCSLIKELMKDFIPFTTTSIMFACLKTNLT